MSSRSSRWLLALLLVAITLAAFEGVRHAGFLNYDDNEYVTANPAVSEGLSAESIGWAFTRTHSSNWHPLTWIAHMVDASIFGTDPGSAAGHHLSNLFVHLLAALILFALLLRLECAPLAAFWIAARTTLVGSITPAFSRSS